MGGLSTRTSYIVSLSLPHGGYSFIFHLIITLIIILSFFPQRPQLYLLHAQPHGIAGVVLFSATEGTLGCLQFFVMSCSKHLGIANVS